jgi:uncharacterized iron-regulated protein
MAYLAWNALLAFGILFTILSAELLAESPSQPFQEGQIREVSNNRVIGFDEFLHQLTNADVIYLGEEHSNRSHVDAALRVMQGLLDRHRLPILGLEMFSWDGQPGLNHYLADTTLPKDEFLKEVHWKKNWGGSYADYEPLIGFAQQHHSPVVALNPPRDLVRKVAKHGFTEARNDPEMGRWRMRDETLVEDAPYREKIFTQIRACHRDMSEAAYQQMYEASVFRDEGMARTIVEQLRSLPDGAGPIVSYTGAGHIQYRLPIPNRVARRSGAAIRQVTVYLAAFDPARIQEIQDLLEQSIADYIWLTPLSTHGPTRRCF